MASPAVAEVYFVAPPPLGSDLNVGSAVAPWASLQQAADSVGAGDTVMVAGGDYAGMQITTSGSPGLPITFQVMAGEVARVVSDNASTPDGINVEGGDWVVVEGFQADGRGRAGISCGAVLSCDDSREFTRRQSAVGHLDWLLR